MVDEKDSKLNEVPFREGYQPLKKGYYPTEGSLDKTDPPQGGSGMPASSPNESGGEGKK